MRKSGRGSGNPIAGEIAGAIGGDASGAAAGRGGSLVKRGRRTTVRALGVAEEAPREAQGLLLDSHVWLWLLSGHQHRLVVPVLQQLIRPEPRPPLAISDATPWELMTKAHRGRLQLDLPPAVWMARALQAPGIQVIPLRREVLLEAATLPVGAPRDPYDRVIIATARLEGMTLVTADEAILSWAKETKAVGVLAAAG